MFPESNINRLPLVFKADAGKNYFQFHINGQLASLEYYMKQKGRIVLERLEISQYLNKVEVGNALIERVLEYVYQADFKIVAIDPEVKKYLQKNSQYQKLVALDSPLDHYAKPVA